MPVLFLDETKYIAIPVAYLTAWCFIHFPVCKAEAKVKKAIAHRLLWFDQR
jgi:hypothetical protein